MLPNELEGVNRILLTRYALFFEGEDQEVGFMMGLDDIGFKLSVAERLMQPFDIHLLIPQYSTFALAPGEQTAAYFTEEGIAFFEEHIKQLVRSIRRKNNGYTLERSQVELSEDNPLILYQDEHQMILRKPRVVQEIKNI